MWLYKEKEISSLEDFGDEVPFGFVYVVTHTPTGKKYIGKKSLFTTQNKKLGKKELAEQPVTRGRKATKKKVTKESDWKTYHGSNEEIIKLIKEGKQSEFKREILHLCYNKKLLTYYETKFQFIYEVLEKPSEYLNSNILGSFFNTDFI